MPMPYRDTGWYHSFFGGLERRVSFQTKQGKMTRLEASVGSRFVGPKGRGKRYQWVVHVGSWMGRELLHKRGLASSESEAKRLANAETRKAIRRFARPVGRR